MKENHNKQTRADVTGCRATLGEWSARLFSPDLFAMSHPKISIPTIFIQHTTGKNRLSKKNRTPTQKKSTLPIQFGDFP